MKLIAVLAFLIIYAHFANATSESSSVYSCTFVDGHNYTLRMKEYFDSTQNMSLGKVDLMQDLEAVESFPTKVYHVPLSDNQTYMQIWYSPEIRVDAQFSASSTNRIFQAIYNRGGVKWLINCENRIY